MNKRKYTKENLTNLVKSVTSIRQLILKLKLKESGGSYAHFKKLIRYYNIDTSHFLGCGWSKGKDTLNSSSIMTMATKLRTPNDAIFIENSPPINGEKLRKRLIELGVEYKCVICNNSGVWLNKPITLQVDHINGTNNDNRLENLRFLCPNCHCQTPTWGNKKTIIKKVSPLCKKDSCQMCGSPCRIGCKVCKKCYNLNRKNSMFVKKVFCKFNVTKDELENLVSKMPISKISKIYGVSDNSIRKKCIKFGIQIKYRRGEWSKIYASMGEQADPIV